MKNIFTSATKIVFMAIAFALIGLTFMGRVEAKDFMILAMMVFSFYYKVKDTSGQDVNNTEV